MGKQLVEIVLPRLAKRLHLQMKRYQDGQLSEAQFTRNFERLLQRQYDWLAGHGIPDTAAALAIHGAVLVLSRPGLRAEAAELKVPMEVIEHRAVRAAAQDISRNYPISVRMAEHKISTIVARHSS